MVEVTLKATMIFLIDLYFLRQFVKFNILSSMQQNMSASKVCLEAYIGVTIYDHNAQV